MTAADGKLGILAGSGALPGRLVALCRQIGRQVFVVAFEGQTDPTTVSGVEHVWVRLGAGGEALDHLKAAGARELVMIGPVSRPSLRALRPDLRTMKFFAKIGADTLGDDGLLSSIVKQLEGEGFVVRGAHELLADLIAVEGVYGDVQPDAQAELDIARGVAVAQALGAVDVGQAVVVQQGIVLGVEAVEGTDSLLERCRALRREGAGGVLVKLKKPSQEARVDLPTIGIRTLEGAVAAGLRGIAVEADAALVVDPAALAKAANEAGLFLIGIRVET